MKPLTTIVIIGLLPFVLSGQVDVREHYVHYPTFNQTIKSILDNNVIGYQYSLGDESGIDYSNRWGLTRSSQDGAGGAQDWSNNSQMMSASIAKMITTVAIMDMLESANVPGAPTIANKLALFLEDYIPIRWRSLIDGNEDRIRLRHLMRHHSGLAGINSVDPKTALSGTMNVAIPDAFDYENVNFDLAAFMAVYMRYPNTMANLENNLQGQSNAIYDAQMRTTIRSIHYNWVQNNIFDLAGITAECAININNPSTTEVYKYGAPNDINGTDFGTVSTCMSNGWIISARDMIRFIQKWANPNLPGNILTATSVDLINDFPQNASGTPLGWVSNRDTDISEGYGHNGIWRNCNTNSACDAYTSAIVLTQDNFYMAINVNSNSNTNNPLNRGIDLVSAYDVAVCADQIFPSSTSAKKYNSAAESIVLNNNHIISNGTTRVFKAGDRIQLNPGFHARSGSTVRAYLASCANPPTENP